ncbi:MAG: tripartite tricarboxylate transporter TctB family protein [Alphaproteobacteria bacterium]|nr:tripartite tricarboxylate transporter TctB family protein [Alphaproteobacteria bacterium]
MSDRLSPRSIAAGVAFVLLMAAYLVMLQMGLHRTVLVIPLALAWTAALLGLKPLVEEDKHNALYFAFGIMAFMIFFLHETYALKGKERTFPLIIGYAGVVLSLLDIASITETRAGHVVTRFFGADLDPAEIRPRALTRELAIFLVMGLGVLGIWLFGFLIASPIFVFLWMLIGGGKSVKLSLYVGLATFVFIYGLFELVLKYELFRGIVTTWVMETAFE